MQPCPVSLGGAKVFATVRSPEKARIAVAAGAAMSSTAGTRMSRVLALCPGGVHRIVEVDFGANIVIDGAAIAPNGKIARYSATSNRGPQLPLLCASAKRRHRAIRAGLYPVALGASASHRCRQRPIEYGAAATNDRRAVAARRDCERPRARGKQTGDR
jgi:NADPH:quinone reductase-like Zn-dependent oxidoreductase